MLETSRLVLRKILRRDAADMYEYSRDPEVTRYLLWEPHPDRYYTARYVAYLQTKYHLGEFFDWAVISRADNRMIGTCGFTKFDFEANSAEVGYVLGADHWGRGIAPEAARIVMHYGFCELGLRRIEARYMVGNDRSGRVMTKLGMISEGTAHDAMVVKGKSVSITTCSISREDFIRKYGM